MFYQAFERVQEFSADTRPFAKDLILRSLMPSFGEIMRGPMRRKISELLSWSVDVRCKIKSYLRLRAACRYPMLDFEILIARINECTRKKTAGGLPNTEVIEWSQIVIKSGWLQQIWPSHVVRRYDLRLKYRGGKHGLPVGMHQDHFDDANRKRKKLGWSFTESYTGVLDARGRQQIESVSMRLTL